MMSVKPDEIKELVGHVFEEAGDNTNPKKKVLMIVANPAVSKKTKWPIGYWAAELTHSYLAFHEAGCEVVLASPEGGKVEMDSFSDPRDESGYAADDVFSLGFINTPSLMSLTENTQKLSDVIPREYDAIFLVGGQSPMYTFRGNENLMTSMADFYETKKPTAIVCHSTSILLDTKRSDGEYLVKNKVWTGFANSEEKYADKVADQKI